MEEKTRPRVLSGIQPTGGFTLGNYIGAIRNWDKLQDECECFYCVADLHSLTVRNNPEDLRSHIREAAAMLLACGVDPKRAVLFIQGDVSAHSELSWILSCYTQFGELSRMTQFKDKSAKHPDNVNAGLFTYPVLMAADILLYSANLVPVGSDQMQHLEITRDIADRFNKLYGEIFTLPEGYLPKVGVRVMSLQDPMSKMSKSDTNANARIMLTDPRDVIIKKFKRAITDSGSEVRAADDKPGIVNLMTIYSAVSGKSFEDIEREFDGKGYGAFKTAVGESVADVLAPVQQEYNRILADPAELQAVLDIGKEKAAVVAKAKLAQVKHAIGLK